VSPKDLGCLNLFPLGTASRPGADDFRVISSYIENQGGQAGDIQEKALIPNSGKSKEDDEDLNEKRRVPKDST